MNKIKTLIKNKKILFQRHTMGLYQNNRFNFFLSILIVIDLILITLTLISDVGEMYYSIVVFDTVLCIILLIEFFTRLMDL